MSGSQLLRATEKSAGHRDLPQWHDQLTEIKRQWMQNVAEINTDRELLQREEETQAKCRREEERLKQRENCERELAFLTVMLHYKTYFDRKTQYDSLKEAERRGKQRIAQLKRELQPFTTEQTNMVKRVEELDKALKETKEATDKCTTQIRRKKDQVGQAEARTRQTRENLEALQGAAQTRAESIKKCETNIKHHEAVLERGPPAAADVSEEIARLEAIAVEQAQIREAYLSIQENQNAWTAERDDYTREKNQAEAEVTRLQDSARQREMKMQNEDKGTYAALQWIRQNHDRLKGKVYDPVRLAITPTKPEYAKYLDACINQHTTRVCFYSFPSQQH